MKVKDVVYHVANLVSMTDVSTILTKRDQEIEIAGTYVFESGEYAKIKKVTDALSVALERIAREYVPFCATDIVSSNSDSKIILKNLKKTVCRIVSAVAVKTGAKSYIKADDDTAEVEHKNTSYYLKYHYVPEMIGVGDLDEEIELPMCLSRTVVAYATARDLSLMTASFDEAETWQEKMEESLKRSLRPAREIKVGRRRFL